jgi:hypothetical protein
MVNREEYGKETTTANCILFGLPPDRLRKVSRTEILQCPVASI